MLLSFSGWGAENFLKKRSPASNKRVLCSFPVASFTHVALLARPPKRVVGPQTGHGSISALMLLLYRMAMDWGRVSLDRERISTVNGADRMRRIAKIWFFIIPYHKRIEWEKHSIFISQSPVS
jgi:hypothetical protein